MVWSVLLVIFSLFIFYALYKKSKIKNSNPNTLLKKQLEKESSEMKTIKGSFYTDYELPPIDRSWNKIITIESFSDKGHYYDVNLHKLTCSCPDFKNIRQIYDINNTRRLCKHLIKVMSDNLKLLNYSLLDKAIFNCIENGYSIKNIFIFDTSKGKVAITYNPDKEWQNVFTDWVTEKLPNSNRLYYGFNIVSGYWAYKERPDNVDEIEKIFTGLSANY